MKYLLFDQNAISTYVSQIKLQSIEYPDGTRFLGHIKGKHTTESFYNTIIDYQKDGILFVGPRNRNPNENDFNKHVFCIDLTTCKLLEEERSDARILFVLQKAFRLVLKIWNANPFSASEKINGSKSILFPFSIGDSHRLVIERSNQIPRLEARDILFPLLAYKYNAEEPGPMVEIADTSILRLAGEMYAERRYILQSQLEKANTEQTEQTGQKLEIVGTQHLETRDDFIYWTFEQQMTQLTEPQKEIVELENYDIPLRIDGAAGTGKTMALIMRAYRMLNCCRERDSELHVIFFAHSKSTNQRNLDIFQQYENSNYFLNRNSKQSIQFTTLLAYCRKKARIEETSLIETNAAEAKEYQLYIIDEILNDAFEKKQIQTYFPLISDGLKSIFDSNKTKRTVLINMLQHEFSIQIKGRTDCTIESYQELESIPNGIPCINKVDKELIFSLFTAYQKQLQSQGTFDVDDVTIEALSRLNAPVWRRRRQTEGFDYIIVDEMHLFNLNEQSIFHFLTKDITKKDIPICFALDYTQTIGDIGNTDNDYISSGKFGNVKEHSLGTLFRNSPQIAEFCASIAASGTIMFADSFKNPYSSIQTMFTQSDERRMISPILQMYKNDEALLNDLNNHLQATMKLLQCHKREIAVVSFDNRWTTSEGVKLIESVSGQQFQFLRRDVKLNNNQYVLAAPYDVNGLEFKAVIMLGVDEGRVPQTFGTSDISRHFIMYSAYNMLYLVASRAKYCLIAMGSELNGISSCLEHSISSETIKVIPAN